MPAQLPDATKCESWENFSKNDAELQGEDIRLVPQPENPYDYGCVGVVVDDFPIFVKGDFMERVEKKLQLADETFKRMFLGTIPDDFLQVLL